MRDDGVSLKTGSRLQSPKMATGSHCLEMDVTGSGLEMAVFVTEGASLVSYRSINMFTDTIDKVQTKRILLENVKEGSRIFISRMKSSGESAILNVHRTALLAKAACKDKLDSGLVWTLDSSSLPQWTSSGSYNLEFNTSIT